MKKLVVLSLLSLGFLGINQSKADVLFSDNFNAPTYSDGNLAGLGQDALGQGTWQQTSTSTATPVQVINTATDGEISLGTSGQDVYSALTTPIASLTDGQSVYFGLDIDVSSAQAAGDYFLHFTTPLGTTSAFFGRTFIQSSGSGFVLGWLGTSGGSAATYGTTVLNFGTDYRIVMVFNYSDGTTANANGQIYVDPTSATQGGNTSYVDAPWGTTTAVPTAVSAVNFRQGSAASAAALTVDNLVVSTDFASAAAVVPEPSTIALSLFGALVGLAAWRRKH
jgi:PEP-CTERM motif